MTHGSGPTVVTPVEAAADTPLSALKRGSPVDPAAAFLAGELLSRAEARAGAAGLVPSDLRADGARPAALDLREIQARTRWFLCGLSRRCFTWSRLGCGSPDPDTEQPLNPPVTPRPVPPGEPDAPDR
jgi:hypothetical protein